MPVSYLSPSSHNKHSNIQFNFLCLCRLQQLTMPSKLTVVVLSLLLAIPAVIFWLWLVILPARVSILCPEKCKCAAGGYYVNCTGSSLIEIPSILPTNVRGLLLDNNSITYLENDSFVSRGLTELTNLQADCCQIRTIELGAFNGLTKLKRLSMRSNKISEIIGGTFDKMSSLEYLDLEHNIIERLEVNVFSKLINLKHMNLAQNKLHCSHPDIFVGLPKLEAVHLSKNPDLKTPTDSPLTTSHSSSDLEISFSNASSISPETFANVTALEFLDLRHNNLRNLDINILRSLPKLSKLYLLGNPLQCDCQLQEVWQLCQKREIETAYNQRVPNCDTPSDVKGLSWEVLKEGNCLNGSIQYDGDYINKTYNHTTTADTDKDMDTGSERKENTFSLLKQYQAPVYAVPFIFGTIGNVMLIIIIACNKDMQTVPNMYILNLAISDLTCLTVHFFEACASRISYTWLQGEFICTFLPFCRRLSAGLAAYSVALLSVYRYRVTVNPFLVRVPSQPSWRATVATICGVWILAALFAIPSALSKYLCNGSMILGHVTYHQRVVIFELLVSCIFPVCVMAFCYIMTACHLVKMSSSMSEETQNPQMNALRNTAKVVLVVTVIFVISYVPYHAFITYVISRINLKFYAFNSIKFTMPHNTDVEYTIIILKCLLLINSCLNPVALYCMSIAFRTQFKRYLTCCCKAKAPPNHLELTRRN
jgi:hypothetical protein